ncbi:HAMP domain-containing histidine kinase [Paenibacillus athensensis]|uniref:histidine kinase n=1 Tax=Paenibacillus athensensis TaxID=1967502 RepID=A0A4Y8QA42_9BACL|nr:HAMP domain-containing sensor histidine kinase [Paenibacillus athensensis]MCD1257730.1 HAMP domain-containing histidine kinase [Paenibacillus athensensis]
MLHSVVYHELQGLLYILSAMLMYLILTPVLVQTDAMRKLLFLIILLGLSALYLNEGGHDPLIYTLQLTPISISVALLTEGSLPAIATWLAFNVGSVVFMNNPPLPTLLASALILAAGLYAKRKMNHDSLWAKQIFGIALLSAYTGMYWTIEQSINAASPERSAIILTGSFLSSCIVMYACHQVQKHELSREKLFQLEKDRMVGQLAASVSHEIRNPLTTTRGFLQMMERMEFSEEDRKRYIALALSGIDQANAIITDYLNYAKPATDQRVLLDVCEELGSVTRFITPMAHEARIAVHLQFHAAGPVYIRAESKKLRQCLMNLIKNAIESMPEGGKLTIKTQQVDDKVHIMICDTGVGMSKAQIHSLGVPFKTTKQHGTGLGLVVVLGLVKTMGGSIKFTSQPGKGTLCTLQFDGESA